MQAPLRRTFCLPGVASLLARSPAIALAARPAAPMLARLLVTSSGLLPRPFVTSAAFMPRQPLRIAPPTLHKRSYHNAPPPEGDPSITPPQSLIFLFGLYIAAINAGAVALFWYDKRQATTKGWRVPEKQLQLTALLGGWAGGDLLS
ncbi:hypothetical protein HDU98_012320 [Podochytrium sp. JEL0797]|nr:hypothetical protein HDU98_012314 [Podochytrium sp. JEL0797]KAJ3074033.1 hypothetical protein HDU98_012320 [Podochytrium sp. JEL0797]